MWRVEYGRAPPVGQRQSGGESRPRSAACPTCSSGCEPSRSACASWRAAMSDELVHPSAVVVAGAALARDVRVGPGSVIGPDVRLGEGTVVGAHAVLEGRVLVG